MHLMSDLIAFSEFKPAECWSLLQTAQERLLLLTRQVGARGLDEARLKLRQPGI